jgi:lipopolysaccharide export system permease protein
MVAKNHGYIMRIPLTFSFYMVRQFLATILATLAVILVVITLIELLELMRRSGEGSHHVAFLTALQMALLKVPLLAGRIYPFVFLVGGMVALSRLTRLSELVAARAAGLSVWQFMMPGLVLCLIMGLVIIGFISPISAAMTKRFDSLEARHFTNRASTLSVSSSGLWLRQVQDETDATAFLAQPVREYIMHAWRMNVATKTLQSVIIFFYDKDHHFIGRLDAPKAKLGTNTLRIAKATISAPGIVPEPIGLFTLPTQLTVEEIQDSFLAPETLSFWELPGFIATLESAGFSGLRHRLYWHSLLALPLLLAGMVLISAVFSLRQARGGKTGVLIVGGVVFGFVFYFISNVIYALGASGALPVILAAWAPSLAVVALGSALLLHLEDG